VDEVRVVMLSALVLVVGALTAVAQDDLFAAARHGTVDDVLDLISSGADVNAMDRDGFTPLLLAVQSNTVEVIEVLLDAGADRQFVNPYTGRGAFAYAWRNPDSAAVNALLGARGFTLSVQVPPTAPTAPPSGPESAPAPLGDQSARGTSQPSPRGAAEPFAFSQVRSHWTRDANVLGGNAIIVPEVRFMLHNDRSEDIGRLTIRAEFYLRRSGGVLERFGNATTYVVGAGDLPMRPGVQEEVRLRSGVGYVDNNSATVRDIKRGAPPATLVELYFRTGSGDWTRFASFDVANAYR
jgi:ankyrin repeat protein